MSRVRKLLQLLRHGRLQSVRLSPTRLSDAILLRFHSLFSATDTRMNRDSRIRQVAPVGLMLIRSDVQLIQAKYPAGEGPVSGESVTRKRKGAGLRGLLLGFVLS